MPPAEVLPALRDAAALVYVDDLDEPRLEEADAHHLVSVLRLRTGMTVVVTDGFGSFRPCAALVGSRSGRSAVAVRLEPAGDVTTMERVGPSVAVGFSLAKGDRTEWAVAKLTELGVDTIVPLTCDRTVVRWDTEKSLRSGERLRRIAREASMQARRVFLPEVLDPLTLEEAAGQLGGTGVGLAEPGGEPLSLATPAVLVGPEGGFSERELALGFRRVGLGPTVLRIETAAVAAGVVLTALRAGNVLPRAT